MRKRIRLLSAEQAERYSRNILLREVGQSGQERLLSSRVLLVGAGGLGSSAGLYLAAAGVGTIGVADGDLLDLSNLQRQVAHRTASVGRPKTESMAEALKELNPEVRVRLHDRISPENLPLREYDVVLDCSDNFETRFLVNDEAVRIGVGLVTAAVVGFTGQLTTVLPGPDRPCYRCLFEGPPPEGAVPTSAEVGILGSVAGTMGALQATEAQKVLLEVGEPLVGRLLQYDGLSGGFRMAQYGRDPACSAHQARSREPGLPPK